MIVTLRLVTNKKGFINLWQTIYNYPLFCPRAFLKEKGFYINTSTEVKFTKITIKLTNRYKS